MNWLDTLEDDFARRMDAPATGVSLAKDIYDALRSSIDRRAENEFTLHPIDYEDERVAVLAVDKSDSPVLARLDTDGVTTASFGSLVGGVYREVRRPAEEERLVGVYEHERRRALRASPASQPA